MPARFILHCKAFLRSLVGGAWGRRSAAAPRAIHHPPIGYDARVPSPLVFAVPSALLFFVALFLVIRARVFLGRAHRADGVVVTHHIQQSREHRRQQPKLRPVVEYVVDGRTLRVIGAIASSSPSPPVGASVVVFHAPDDPENARIGTATELFFGAIFAATLGFLWAVCGVAFFVANN